MGARRIAGITVEIGGDTTKLTTALKDVDKSLSTTQSSLRDVNKLLKLDPGNTELLAQKHRLLGEAVSGTKEKLATLKTAAEQANQALANGEITQSQYDALQREIIETEQKLKDLERQAENSSVALQKIGQVGDKLQAVGDKVSGVGETLTKSVTAPVVGLGTAAVATAANFESSIKGRDDWEFVAIYTDEGISATNTKRREGFKQMVADALAGKIDLIVTKSVSRFARNTVDSLTTVRKLKDKGIEIYFEKENIWTLDAKGELLITIMSSLAQEESRSISENTTWGQRKRFADGKASVAYKRFLGYDRGPNGGFVVNEEQAKTIKLIYKLFLDGLTCHAIAKELTARKLPTPAGKEVWNQSTVRSILTNEKYKGDALLQKEFTVDFLQKKTKKNEGEVPQYYVEGNHEAIIDPETFD